MTKSKRLPKIQKERYSNRSVYRHDLGFVAFGKTEEYTETDKFLKLKEEYLRNDDEYIQSKRELAKKWLTEESADKLLKEVREKEEKK